MYIQKRKERRERKDTTGTTFFIFGIPANFDAGNSPGVPSLKAIAAHSTLCPWRKDHNGHVLASKWNRLKFHHAIHPALQQIKTSRLMSFVHSFAVLSFSPWKWEEKERKKEKGKRKERKTQRKNALFGWMIDNEENRFLLLQQRLWQLRRLSVHTTSLYFVALD